MSIKTNALLKRVVHNVLCSVLFSIKKDGLEKTLDDIKNAVDLDAKSANEMIIIYDEVIRIATEGAVDASKKFQDKDYSSFNNTKNSDDDSWGDC